MKEKAVPSPCIIIKLVCDITYRNYNSIFLCVLHDEHFNIFSKTTSLTTSIYLMHWEKVDGPMTSSLSTATECLFSNAKCSLPISSTWLVYQPMSSSEHLFLSFFSYFCTYHLDFFLFRVLNLQLASILFPSFYLILFNFLDVVNAGYC